MAESLGKYQLERRLAVGGMAEIFLATHIGPEGFKRSVAIKRILPHLSEDGGFVTMFLDEARLVARFSHPNLVQIFDLGESEESFYLAMEYVHGASMDQVLWACGEKGSEFPLEYAAKIVSLACDGLDYAHDYADADGTRLNLIHRDVSPQNIMLSFDGMVKLLDFGIAKAASNIYKTRAGVIKGKASFMSPEQIQGKQDLDRRSDIFSLGVVLYEFTTGARPFSGENEADILRAIVNADSDDPLKHNPDLPTELVQILDRALRKDRDKRYATAREMKVELERFLFSRQAMVDSHMLAGFLKGVLSPEEMAAGFLRTTASGMSRSLEGEPPPTMLTPRPITSNTATHTPTGEKPPAIPADMASGPAIGPRPQTDPTKRQPSKSLVGPRPRTDPGRSEPGRVIIGSRPRTDPRLSAPDEAAARDKRDLFDRTVVSDEAKKQVSGVKVRPVTVSGMQLVSSLPRRTLAAAVGGFALLLVIVVGMILISDDPDEVRPATAATAPQPAGKVQPAATRPEVELDPDLALERALQAEIESLSEEPLPAAAPVVPAVVEEDVEAAGTAKLAREEERKPARVTKRARAGASPARLTVYSKPLTSVFVDGIAKGSTPVEKPIELVPGVHVVELRNKRHGIQHSQKIRIASGKSQAVRKTFGKGMLQVFVKPFGEVVVDGRRHGMTPLERPIQLYEGSHELRVSCKRTGKKQSRTVVIRGGKTTTEKIDLR